MINVFDIYVVSDGLECCVNWSDESTENYANDLSDILIYVKRYLL